MAIAWTYGKLLTVPLVAVRSTSLYASGIRPLRSQCRCLASTSPTSGKIRSAVKKSMGLRPLPQDAASLDVFQHNSWDGVEWTVEERRDIQAVVQRQQAQCMLPEQSEQLLRSKHQCWDQFYDKHREKFFKDRKWLCHELRPHIDDMKVTCEGRHVHILEVGCGVGNAVYPLLEYRDDVSFSAFDFSISAIRSLRRDARYDGGRINSFVYDATTPFTKNGQSTLTQHVGSESVHIVLMLFSLSAIDNAHHLHVLLNLLSVLKPGGLILFRDYAMYDLSQLQLKDGRCIKENLYARGDGTLVNYFTESGVEAMCSKVNGLKVEINQTKNLLIVNRKKKKKMMRSWIQALFRKNEAAAIL